MPQRILREIRIETRQSERRVIDQSERRKTDQSGDCNKARCKRAVVAVGNCTRAMCVRARRCQCSSTESARSPRNDYIYQASLCYEEGGLFRFSGFFLWSCSCGVHVIASRELYESLNIKTLLVLTHWRANFMAHSSAANIVILIYQ